MTKRPAHTVKAGDKINGVEVFDSLRRGFGGFYIPMTDGSRVYVKTQTTAVETNMLTFIRGVRRMTKTIR